MAAPGYLVEGRGDERSLSSASHGAGRRMSRKAAKQQFRWGDVKRFLAEQDVTLLSAGLDEAPWAYKDIDSVMDAQDELVRKIARFMPKMVKMAPAGERPED
jgi:tRNA-splicing ligase RtcB